ncbi:endolytic transglycosylase MltG [Candidatus Saccharibacteria bacterium]|nr:endolytic transglycosylase MltG [Candidatus Saccharibacteria bacterium]
MKLLGLDVGEKRIGVARADSSVRIAIPMGIVGVDGSEFKNLIKIIKIRDIDVVVIGMPRNLQGKTTKQSDFIKAFAAKLNSEIKKANPTSRPVRLLFQDESLTSVEAKNNLKNKKGGINKKAGDIDAEAATLILQDFIEHLETRLALKKAQQASPEADKTSLENPKEESETDSVPRPQFRPYNQNKTLRKWKIIRILVIASVLVVIGALSISAWYSSGISAMATNRDCLETHIDGSAPCRTIEVDIPEGSTLSEIATRLKEAGLIKSPLAFKVFATLSGKSTDLKAGKYQLSTTMSAEAIINQLAEGTGSAVVFRFTSLPGETLAEVKSRIIALGYKDSEVEQAFNKSYNHPVLADKPAESSLEGYLFGETYEFYATDSVETVIVRMLDELYSVVEKNNLRAKFNSMGLTLHEGIILASIIQKEAGSLKKDDLAKVSQVFHSRIAQGIPLGSDVTASYAADQLDPNRQTYTDNASVVSIDSCYNTRRYAGLPCGAISNPGALALIAAANPADTSYLYFLTGDDGMMYYSYTESEHLQNRDQHCQSLCNVSL